MKQIHSLIKTQPNSKVAEINLGNFRPNESRVFSGRDEGFKARTTIRLEEAEKLLEKINVIVPDDTLSFNPSFFLGMFGESVRAMGQEKFKNFYVFKCTELIKANIEENISYALKVSNPLRD